MKRLFTTIILLALAVFVFAQGSITGKVLDDDTGEALIGASVVVKGTTTGTITDYDGSFTIGNLDAGNFTLVISYTGYSQMEMDVNVGSGKTDLGEMVLTFGTILSEIEVTADYAVERRTPVAFANLDKEKIEKVLGSQDIPMAMNLTPSVYATQQGGGAGDARINVRGFNQRNVAIMINGVPVNDMENGWVYWSNWDGVADATSSIQMQRGLSAVNLATPSIGGTMNIITSPADKKAGGTAKFEYGSGNFMKATVTGHSGLINDRFAMSASVVRKVGDGVIDKTWTDAWAYYLGASLKLNDDHKLELFALGAPQRHGQNLYKQNIATYSHEFAEDIEGYDTKAFDDFSEQGRSFNQNWGSINNYNGEQAWNDEVKGDRYDSDFLNERENFFHKPLVNLNWYADWSDKVSQYTVLYYSGGKGGGTGTYGSVHRNDANGVLGGEDYRFYFGPSPWGWNFDETIRMNSGPAGTYYVDTKAKEKADGQSIGILRNSRNNQYTYGALSKVKIDWSKKVKSSIGVDWRTAEIEHYREVRDLLGGQYFINTANEFSPNEHVGLADKIAYNFTNTVDWFGWHAQTEITQGDFSAYGMLGWSTIKYSYINYFKKATSGSGELTSNTDWISGIQVKGGANYIINQNVNVFGNLGFVSKVPIFDAVIDDYSGTKAVDPENEKFRAFEAGANFFSNDNRLKARLSYYYTSWKDRTRNISVFNQDGTDGFIFITGMNQLHTGLELDIKWRPIDLIEVGLTGSIADWEYTNDVSGTYKDYEDGSAEDVTYNFYTDGLKVGDAPQNQLVGSISLFPIEGLYAQLLVRNYSKYYADWDPFSRTDTDDKGIQSWKVPSYTLVDLHAAYQLPLQGRFGVEIFAHVFNLFDEVFIQDAVDNSQYNGFYGDDGVNSHKASAAEVFLGLPRMANVGVKFNF
ncbi:MAG: TonB-dependent receptor [Bacteroidetes bacterium]|nr:TonB-dependent receptor [Bacteroidota bacterium]